MRQRRGWHLPPAQPEQEATPPQEGPATPGARARSPTPKDFSPKDSSPSQVTALPAPRHPPSVPVREPRAPDPPPPPYHFPYRSPYCMPVAPPKAAHRRVQLVRGEGRGVSTWYEEGEGGGGPPGREARSQARRKTSALASGRNGRGVQRSRTEKRFQRARLPPSEGRARPASERRRQRGGARRERRVMSDGRGRERRRAERGCWATWRRKR